MGLPKPYFETELGKLYCADCLEIIPQLEPVDLVLTDPPYGIFKRKDDGIMFGKKTIYSEDNSVSDWDKKPNIEIFNLMLNKSKYYIIWGGNYFADYLGSCKQPLVWNKKTGNNNYADGELAFTNLLGTLRIFNHQWCGAFKDSERGLRAIHPTQKPIALMIWCLSFVDGTVLDPFLGSGTTAVACEQLNRRWIGIEISEKYCEIAAKRIELERQQLKMFGPEINIPKPKQRDIF